MLAVRHPGRDIIGRMAPILPPKVLVLTRDPDAGNVLCDQLRRLGAEVCAAGEIPIADRAFEVVVTDLSQADAASRSGLPLAERTGFDEPQSVGVIGLGACTCGVVTLKDDCPPRELWLACTLLAEVVRLRNQRNAALRRAEEGERLAQLDALTGVANRRAWDEQLHDACRAPAEDCWMALVDLDGFKAINAACGHPAGDDVLRRVAQAMAGALSAGQLLARLGGDEFGVLLRDLDEENSVAALHHLCAAVHATEVPHGCVPLTASVAYVAVAAPGISSRQGIDAADRVLRAAKQAGGDRIVRGALESGTD